MNKTPSCIKLSQLHNFHYHFPHKIFYSRVCVINIHPFPTRCGDSDRTSVGKYLCMITKWQNQDIIKKQMCWKCLNLYFLCITASGRESSYMQPIPHSQKFILALNWLLGSLQKSSWTRFFFRKFYFWPLVKDGMPVNDR